MAGLNSTGAEAATHGQMREAIEKVGSPRRHDEDVAVAGRHDLDKIRTTRRSARHPRRRRMAEHARRPRSGRTVGAVGERHCEPHARPLPRGRRRRSPGRGATTAPNAPPTSPGISPLTGSPSSPVRRSASTPPRTGPPSPARHRRSRVHGRGRSTASIRPQTPICSSRSWPPARSCPRPLRG